MVLIGYKRTVPRTPDIVQSLFSVPKHEKKHLAGRHYRSNEEVIAAVVLSGHKRTVPRTQGIVQILIYYLSYEIKGHN